MSNLLYAAQIAQKGFSDLGEGIGALGDKKSDAAASAAFRETNPGQEGEALGEAIRLGKVEPGAAEQIMNQKASLNPMTLIGHLSKVMNGLEEGDPQKVKIKKDINALVDIMSMSAALKGKAKGSGSSTSDLEAQIIGDGKLDTREKELMKIARKKVKQMRDAGVSENLIDSYYSNFLFKITPGTGEFKKGAAFENIGGQTSEENIQDLQDTTIAVADKLIKQKQGGKSETKTEDPVKTDEASSLSDSLFNKK